MAPRASPSHRIHVILVLALDELRDQPERNRPVGASIRVGMARGQIGIGSSPARYSSLQRSAHPSFFLPPARGTAGGGAIRSTYLGVHGSRGKWPKTDNSRGSSFAISPLIQINMRLIAAMHNLLVRSLIDAANGGPRWKAIHLTSLSTCKGSKVFAQPGKFIRNSKSRRKVFLFSLARAHAFGGKSQDWQPT